MMRTRILTRLIFALLAGVACFLMALVLEGVFTLSNVRGFVNNQPNRTLFFHSYQKNKASNRAALANAKSGDVEITLTWNNRNDLDLHCIDPNGEHLYYAHRRATHSNGELDIDKNAGPPYSRLPAEHVYWPRRDAPDGTYKVYVDEFQRHGDEDPTAFEVTTKEYGRIKKYQGTIRMGRDRNPNDPGQFVCEFSATPSGDRSFFGRVAFLKSAFLIAGWFSLVAFALATAILTGLIPVKIPYQKKTREVLLAPRLFGIQLAYVAGSVGLSPGKILPIAFDYAIWGLFAGFFGQLLYGFLPEEWLALSPTRSHAIALVLIASILGATVGRKVPHINRGQAFLASLLTALLCSRLFLIVYWSGSEMWGRVLVATLLGVAIGVSVSLPIQEPEEEIEIEDRYARRNVPMTLKANRVGPAGVLKKTNSRKLEK